MEATKSYNVKIQFQLKEDELDEVKRIQKKGKASARVIKRARVLELFHGGLTSPVISRYVGVTAETVRYIGWRYLEGGLQRALYDKQRFGNGRLLSPKQEQKIIAIVCSDPPEGRARWTIELLRDEVLKRKIAQTVGSETIRLVLKRHNLKPWREKNVVRGGTER
jgi:putative transposase